jgi:CubicO group peptidase (beta-lactamase class C family)
MAVFLLILLLTANAMADSRTTQIDALFKEFDHPDRPGAAVLVIQNGKVLYERGYGLADLEKKTPCTAKTNFRLASLTKQFTAM